MDSIDSIRERVEALEQQTKAMEAHTHTVERRLRWWRGIACGALMLGVLALTLPSGKAVDAQPGGLPERVEALEDKLAAVTFDASTNELVITRANLRIVNGLNATNTTNGLGNLIVGYNELRPPGHENIRTGSHNVVVGREHHFSSFGGLVVGEFNEISGEFSSVSGGNGGQAEGRSSSISGGTGNIASGAFSSVSGGGDRFQHTDVGWAAGLYGDTISGRFGSP